MMSIVKKHRRLLGFFGAAALAVGLGACGSAETLEGQSQDDAAGSKGEVITIGSANHTEAVILANIYADALDRAGFDAEVKPNLGSREITFPALQDGSLDMLLEYAGALLAYEIGRAHV